jgi:hypothetical protein
MSHGLVFWRRPSSPGPVAVVGMAILKDAILSVVIAVAAIIGAKALGWAWYILGLLWLAQ